jgi:hypothetical protein
MANAAEILRDPAWLCHRYDPASDRFGFVHVPRDQRRRVPFLTDANLPDAAATMQGVDRSAVNATAGGPLHFILHSAFCCSTLLANALDHEGVAGALKEPVVLNDLVGWRARGAPPARLSDVLADALGLLARPMAPRETVIVKPSNLVAPLVPALLAARAESRAILLYAPLPTFLASVASKGLEGRLWVRELAWKLRRDRLLEFGFDDEALYRQTDLQAAALGWLAQQRLFAEATRRLPGRVASLDSETFLERPPEAIAAAGRLFGLRIDRDTAEAVARGPVFARNAKTGETFGRSERMAVHEGPAIANADEIGKVIAWTEVVAREAGVPMQLPAPLLP